MLSLSLSYHAFFCCLSVLVCCCCCCNPNPVQWQDAVWVADVGSGPTRKCKALPEVSPTLTRSRCKLGGHMLLPMKRYMTLVELEELQGFPGGHLRVPAGVTAQHYAGMLGNAFTAWLDVSPWHCSKPLARWMMEWPTHGQRCLRNTDLISAALNKGWKEDWY